MKKKALPAIHVPIQNADGSMQWVWYMFFQWIAENAGAADLSDYFTKEEVEELLSVKLDKTTDSNVLYGTDNDGEQYLYSVSYFAVDSAVVHLAGEEYISGIKHFTDPRGVDVLAVADAAGHGYRITDLNDTNKSSWFLQYKTVNNDVYTRILNAAYNTYCYIDAVIDENGSRRITFASDYTTLTSHPTESTTNSLQVDTVGARVTAINTRADTSLSNLTSVGKNIGNWSSNVTNCITEIPQDIQLELNNGTLTLKAGSKVTYPDGTQITISTDETIPTHSTDGEYVCVKNKIGGAGSFLKSLCYSGTTAPTGFSGNALWFDTTNDIIKNSYDSGATWSNDWSFPVGMVTSASSAYTSIDQVFNGFGYIGSTIFALPNIKGLAPDGRNTDGTLKSVAFTTSSVKTQTLTTNTFNNRNIILRADSFGFSSSASYDEKTNTVSTGKVVIVGNGSASSGKITSLYIKQAFHAVDYDDFISADDQNVKITGNQHIKNIKTFDSGQINIGSAGYYNNKIEFATSSNATNGGYIDFHYAGSTADYTSRIMETASGQLTLTASNGSLLSVSPADTDNSKKIATTEFVNNLKNKNISNCVVDVPQDIKLELSNGVLKLKAGSKLYVPNGPGVFNTISINSDYTFNFSNSTTAKAQVLLELNTTAAQTVNLWVTTNGTPTGNDANRAWDVTNNRFWQRTGTNAWSQLDLTRTAMIGIVTIENRVPISIDQVFNGVGYIGSTVYALPGVKVLLPQGRNADGSLKNTVITKTNVTYGTYTGTNYVYFGISSGTSPIYFQSDTNYSYDPQTNTTNWAVGILGHFVSTSGVYSRWIPKTAYRSVDYNDTDWIANQAMPGKDYINLSLGVTGTTYTAPADGWYVVAKQAGASNRYIDVQNTTTGLGYNVTGPNSGNVMRLTIPVKKGDTILITFDMTGSTSMFRFVYANGAK